MNEGMLDNVLLAFDDVDEFVCLDFCRSAPATLAPQSLWLRIAESRRRSEDERQTRWSRALDWLKES